MLVKIKKHRKLIFLVFSFLVLIYAVFVHHYRFVEYNNPHFFSHGLAYTTYSEHLQIDIDTIDELYVRIKRKSTNLEFSKKIQNFIIDHASITDKHLLNYIQRQPTLTINVYDGDMVIDSIKYNYLTMDNYIKNGKLRINTKNYYDVKWHDIKVDIGCTNCSRENDIRIHYNSNAKNTFKIMDTVKGRKNEYNILFFSLFLVIISAALYIKNKIKLSFKKIIILEFISSILFAFGLLKSFTLLYYYDVYNYLYLGMFIVFGVLLLSILIKKFNTKNLSKLFVVLAIPLGILYMILVPLGEVPDENRHFFRAYGISNGVIITPSNGNEIPVGMYDNLHNIHDYADYFDVIDDQTKHVGYEYISDGADNYNASLYTFSSLGIATGKLFKLNPYYCFYLGRLFNFIFFIVSGYYIMKLMPFGKLVTLIYLLNPMMIHQGMSVSADVVLNQCSLLYIAYLLNIKLIRKKIEFRDIILITMLLALIFVSKYVYAILSLMLFLIRKEIKKMPKELKMKLGCLLGIAAALSLVYYFNFFGLSSSPVKTSSGVVSKNVPLEYLKASPINSIIVLSNTLQHYGSYYVESFAGGYLGWLKVAMGRIFVYAYVLILILAVYDKDDKYKLDISEKWLSHFTAIVITVALILGFYISISQSNLSIVTGVQGRYFIPYLLLPLLALVSDRKKNLNKTLMIILVILINLIALDTIKLYYL